MDFALPETTQCSGDAQEGENESDVVVAELTSPQFDETNSTLTYTAKVLDDYI